MVIYRHLRVCAMVTRTGIEKILGVLVIYGNVLYSTECSHKTRISL